MTHIIIKTSKAKALYHRDQLVAEATSKKELVGYSDDHVETSSDKYIFRVMPVAMPAELINQILDLGNVEGDADVSDVINTLEADIAKIKAAIKSVVISAPEVQIGVDLALEGGDKTVTSELPIFTGNKIENPDEIKAQMETGGKVTEAEYARTAPLPDAEIAPLEGAPVADEGNTAGNPNPQA
jgi:hypothetical protein